MVLGLGRPEGMPRASSSAELMDAAATALARLRGGRSACAIIFSSRTICTANDPVYHCHIQSRGRDIIDCTDRMVHMPSREP